MKKDYISILMFSYSISSGALGSPDLLPSCYTITTSLHIEIILIITPTSSINKSSCTQVHNEKLIQHECSRNVLVVGLRSEAQKVRKMCAAFAVLVGKKEPTVFRYVYVYFSVL
jgi:hypothetical protein